MRPRRRAAAMGVCSREWGRIGCIGFGGPPAHIALLRELCVERRDWMERARVRGRDRGHQPPARPGLDAAGDLLRVAAARSCRGARRRARLHRPGADRHPRAGGPLPGHVAARRGCSARAPARAPRSPPSRCTPPRASRRRAGGGRPRSRHAGSSTPSRARVSAATVGAWLVLVLLACGAVEVAVRRGGVDRGAAPVAAAARRRRRRPVGCSRSHGSRSRSGRSPTAAAS